MVRLMRLRIWLFHDEHEVKRASQSSVFSMLN